MIESVKKGGSRVSINVNSIATMLAGCPGCKCGIVCVCPEALAKFPGRGLAPNLYSVAYQSDDGGAPEPWGQ